MVHTYKFNVSLEESSDFLFFGELEKMNLKNKIMFNILYVQYGINRGWYKLLNLLYSVPYTQRCNGNSVCLMSLNSIQFKVTLLGYKY